MKNDIIKFMTAHLAQENSKNHVSGFKRTKKKFPTMSRELYNSCKSEVLGN